MAGGQLWSDSWWADSDSAHIGRAGQVPASCFLALRFRSRHPLGRLIRPGTTPERTVPHMLWTILVILLVLWLLGLLGSIAGSTIHLLLVLAVIVLIVQLVRGRSRTD